MTGPVTPDITGGNALGDAIRGAHRSAERTAQEELAALIGGHLSRELAEIRAHIAFIERHAPSATQRALRIEFGRLLSEDPPEYTGPPGAAGAPHSP